MRATLSRRTDAQRVVLLSRVVWDIVVEPTWVAPCSDSQPLTQDTCVQILRVAEALFPLVPRACRSVLAAAAPQVRDTPCPGDGYRSVSYFVLECAAMAAGGGRRAAAEGGEECSPAPANREGSGRCVRWLLARRPPGTRNVGKESMVVWWGLCVGGHLEMAQEFVAGGRGGAAEDFGNCGPVAAETTTKTETETETETETKATATTKRIVKWWWERCGLCWCAACGGSVGEENLIVRDETKRNYADPVMHKATLLTCVCSAGHLGVAKWIVKRFRVKTWDSCVPFFAAVRGGHLEVAQWLAWRIDVRLASKVLVELDIYQVAASSGSLKMIQWIEDVFPHKRNDEYYAVMSDYLNRFLESNKTAKEEIEGCKWFLNQCPEVDLDLDWFSISHKTTLQWVIQNGLTKPSKGKGCLWSAYHEICDPSLVEWLFDNYEERINMKYDDEFCHVFSNKKDSVAVVKCMLERTKDVPPRAIELSIESALEYTNFAVADWLEATYHLTKRPTEREEGPARCMKQLVLHDVARLKLQPLRDSPAALKWFLRHVPVGSIERDEAIQAVQRCLKLREVKKALFLLETFHLPRGTQTQRMWNKVLKSIPGTDFSTAPQLAKLGNFTESDMAQILPEALYFHDLKWSVHSSKVLKWLIESYNVTAEQVKANENVMLSTLITKSKTGAAEWLIKKFHITLPEVLGMHKPEYISESARLSTWRMLLRVYPEMTADNVRESLLWIATASPCNMDLSIRKLGLTKEEIKTHITPEWRTGSPEIQLWYTIKNCLP
ncbi:hypothetical protein Pelo_15794 [Pelomyxa schiedti]|nr:hypothetical protein Pelo_15794 [Pelomyxa schiedti]